MAQRPTCMICGQADHHPQFDPDDVHFVCRGCDAAQTHLLDDDDDPDGRETARHLTILSIDIDE